MHNKWTRLIIIGLVAVLMMAVVVRWMFWQELLNITSGDFFAERWRRAIAINNTA